MPNYLKMVKRQQVIALLDLGWTYRRIESETGVRRETVSRYDRLRRANAAKVFAGSGLPPRSAAAACHSTIVEKHEAGLTAQRIWQDLVEELGYGHSYESVKRYVRRLRKTRRVSGVIHAAPGEEAQVDFFQGVPTLDAASGEWKRPWVFRMTLGCSRHGYEEAVWDQKIETFLRLHEHAFRDFDGVPTVVRHDNLKAGVVRACLYDPDSNVIYAAFARHYGFTALPTRPSNPRENGKQERSGGYVKDNALKGRRFDSLDECNAFLRRWNRTVARLRIHGTTRRQVFSHFVEVEQPTLQPLPRDSFEIFECGQRTVHPDGHVEVAGSFYPVPSRLLGQHVQVRWDDRLVRVFHDQTQVAVHKKIPPGQFAPGPGQTAEEMSSSQRGFFEKLLGRCERVGPDLRRWAEAAHEVRGVRAFRLVQGVLTLTRSHPRERILHAARIAAEHRLFRFKDLQRLADQGRRDPRQRPLLHDHPAIRPITEYRLEDLT